MLRGIEEEPCGRRQPREYRRGARRFPRVGEAACGAARQRPFAVAVSRQNGEGHRLRDLGPAQPSWQLLEDVCSHQPDEMRTWKAPPQLAQCIDREARAKRCLDAGGDYVPAIRDPAGRGKPLGEAAHSTGGLQRISGRDHQPHLIETQTPAGEFRNMAMACMGRIEGAAEQADTHPAVIAA